jgi:hypothetical protein
MDDAHGFRKWMLLFVFQIEIFWQSHVNGEAQKEKYSKITSNEFSLFDLALRMTYPHRPF